METPVDPDAQLMLRVKEGDRDAFEALVDKYKRPVMNMAYRILTDLAEAEDLSQRVFLQVYKAAGRYRISAKFSTWIFTITRNQCLNEIRRRSRHPADSLDKPMTEGEDEPQRQLEDPKGYSAPAEALHHELEEKIREALGTLPENQRTAISLCREGDLTYEDIAEVLGCSVSATKSLIHRGRETLKGLLKPYLRTGVWGGKE